MSITISNEIAKAQFLAEGLRKKIIRDMELE